MNKRSRKQLDISAATIQYLCLVFERAASKITLACRYMILDNDHRNDAQVLHTGSRLIYLVHGTTSHFTPLPGNLHELVLPTSNTQSYVPGSISGIFQYFSRLYISRGCYIFALDALDAPELNRQQKMHSISRYYDSWKVIDIRFKWMRSLEPLTSLFQVLTEECN